MVQNVHVISAFRGFPIYDWLRVTDPLNLEKNSWGTVFVVAARALEGL